MTLMADPLLDMQIDGLAELLGGLKGAQKALATEQRRANKGVSEQVAEWARSAASGGTAQQARAASAIAPRSTQKTARLAVNTGRVRYANAAFWGMARRTGWYAHERYKGSAGRQAPKWVGADWIAGRKGEGPYIINDTIADRVEQIEALYVDAYERALKGAFPGGFE